MPEPRLHSKRSSTTGKGSRRATTRKAASSRKSSTSKAKSSAASKKSSRSKNSVKSEPVRARPAILYCLALVCVMAIGAFSIRAIHAGAPVADGFETVQAAPNQTSTANAEPAAPPVSAELMRKQGWVAPASLELYKRERRKSELPPEIAAVPETLIETEVLKPEGDGYLPPPPIAGTPGSGVAGTETGFSSDQLFPSDQAVPIKSGESTAAMQQNSDQIQSMLAGINNQGKPEPVPVNEPAQRRDQRVTLLQAQAECADKGFISRIACNDRVREEFCSDRWNELAGCERDEDANF